MEEDSPETPQALHMACTLMRHRSVVKEGAEQEDAEVMEACRVPKAPEPLYNYVARTLGALVSSAVLLHLGNGSAWVENARATDWFYLEGILLGPLTFGLPASYAGTPLGAFLTAAVIVATFQGSALLRSNARIRLRLACIGTWLFLGWFHTCSHLT